jgi:AraC-like DNA-binding protein
VSGQFLRRLPRPDLRGLVRDYVAYAERGAVPVRRREIPTGEVHLILSFGPTIDLRSGDGDGPPDERLTSFLVGLQQRPGDTEHGGVQRGVQVNLSPVGAVMLFGGPADRFANRVVATAEREIRWTDELTGRLADLPGWQARFALLDEALAARLADAVPPRTEVVWAWRRIRARSGRLAIEPLAAELGVSRRWLQRHFREQIGLPPKALAGILRFRRAVDLLRTGTHTFADVAVDCGYYDQAHLNRDFRTLAGMPPSALVGTDIGADVGADLGAAAG